MPDHRANEHEHVGSTDAAVPPRHRGRRVSTPPPVGSDPHPVPEPGRHAASENDEQLKRDKPPHWG